MSISVKEIKVIRFNESLSEEVVFNTITERDIGLDLVHQDKYEVILFQTTHFYNQNHLTCLKQGTCKEELEWSLPSST